MATDYFLEIEGIKGESEDSLHPNTIEVLSFSFGASNPTKRRYGKVSLQDFHFTAYSSSASEQLSLRLRNNSTYIKLATLYGVQSDEAGARFDAYTIKMTDCLVSSYSIGAHEGSFVSPGGSQGSDPVPVDNVSLKVAGYDLKKATKL